MLVCGMRKPMGKAGNCILRTFCDENTTTFSNRFLTRGNYTVQTSNFCSVDRNLTYSLGSKSVKCSPIFMRAHYLIKSQVRRYSANQTTGLPQLTCLPQTIWPGVFGPFSNLFLSYLVIRPFVDSTFDLREFATASKQVVQIVSRKLASNDVDGLEEMMTIETLNEIKRNLPKFSVEQRQELAVDQGDIYLSAPSDMVFRNDRENNKKSLQITMVHHVIRGLKDLNFEGFSPFQNMMNSQQPPQSAQVKIDESKAYILNYKFVREYSSDMASDWLLSGINHYKKSQIVAPGFPF